MQIGKEMAIPSILKIGNGALGKIGGYLKAENLDQVVLFFGNGLIDMFGELVMNSLKEAEVNVLEYNELDTVDIDDIITLAFAIPNKAKAVISIGGGKVIDAGKYAAFLRNLPFISVPTSSSSDGFSSASASLLVQGKRTSVPARLAYGIIVDTQVIRTAPEKFIYSGIGDMISKITAPLMEPSPADLPSCINTNTVSATHTNIKIMLITTLNASISHLLMSSRFYITIYCTQLQQHFTRQYRKDGTKKDPRKFLRSHGDPLFLF